MEVIYLKLLLTMKHMKSNLLFQNKKQKIAIRGKIITYLLFFLFPGFSFSQNAIGLNIGINQSFFYDTHKASYYKFTNKTGYSFSAFYEKKLDERSNLKIESQYSYLNSSISIKRDEPLLQKEQNINYSFHQSSLGLLYKLRFFELKSKKLYFIIGLNGSYILKTNLTDIGWENAYNKELVNGVPTYVYSSNSCAIHDKNSKVLSQLNLGFDFGLEFEFPINNKLDFVIQNKFNICLTDKIASEELRNLSYFSNYLNLGVKYHLLKSKI